MTVIQQSQQKSRIPTFKNSQELAEFWDTHDVTDYLDELEPVEIDFQLEKPKDDNIVIRVQEPIKQYLRQVARSKGLNLSSLARMWLMEHMKEQVKAV